jgi:hypothetical protein
MSSPEVLSDFVQVGEGNLPGSSEEQAEGDRLGVTIGKLRVGRLREKEMAPLGGKPAQRCGSELDLLAHLVAKESAEAGGCVGEFSNRSWGKP